MSAKTVNGPCWFCRKNTPTDDMVMDREFDTDVHLSCILQRLERDPCDEEARLMSYLLDPDRGQTGDNGEPGPTSDTPPGEIGQKGDNGEPGPTSDTPPGDEGEQGPVGVLPYYGDEP